VKDSNFTRDFGNSSSQCRWNVAVQVSWLSALSLRLPFNSMKVLNSLNQSDCFIKEVLRSITHAIGSMRYTTAPYTIQTTGGKEYTVPAVKSHRGRYLLLKIDSCWDKRAQKLLCHCY
jgi:hypothetical protein